MRLVDYQKSTTVPSYRWLERLGLAAGVFTAIITLLMFADWLATRHADPIHAPALVQLTHDLNANPKNEALKEQIRDLDFLARRAFFRSQHFEEIAKYLLAIGALTAVAAFKTLGAYRQALPYPRPNPARDDLTANTQWARRAISSAGLILVGLALVLSLPWKSPLDRAMTAKSSPSARLPASQQKNEELSPSSLPSQNWPGFLGSSRGLALGTELPIAWDGKTGQGIAWKTEIPRPGRSSPVIWNDRIFLTGADATTREVYCLDAKTGAMLWRHQANDIPGSPSKAPEVTEDATLAAPTMVTDGARAFAIFGTGDLVALDFDGKRLWARNLGTPDNSYGHGSSLALADNTVLVQLDQNKAGQLLALNAVNGETRWKVERAFKASWATPLVTEVAGQRQIVLAAAPGLASYKVDSGLELWRIECFGHAEVAPSPVYANGLFYAAAEGAGILAIDPAKRTIVWQDKESAPGVSTPAVVGDLLFYGLNDGGIVCRDTRSGAKVWETETDDGFYSSPLHSQGRLYLVDRAGVTHIFSATNRFDLIGRPALGEESAANPGARDKSLYLRSKKHLFRIGT